MKTTNVLTLASLSIGAGVVAAFLVAPTQHEHDSPAGKMSPMWAHHYDSLTAMTQDADAVVLARVVDSEPGRVMPAGDGVLPFTLVHLAVDEVLFGDAPPVITIEQTGGLAEGQQFYMDGDGGAYVRGTQALLFLKLQPESGYYYLSNPMGRFHVVKGALQAVAPDEPVARELDRATVGAATEAVKQAANG